MLARKVSKHMVGTVACPESTTLGNDVIVHAIFSTDDVDSRRTKGSTAINLSEKFHSVLEPLSDFPSIGIVGDIELFAKCIWSDAGLQA